MIAGLAAKMSAFFVSKGTIKKEDAQAYSYGFELLFSTVINLALIFVGAIIMGIFPHTLLYLAGLIPLRLTAGGYHAKHHWSCITIACVAYVLSAFPLRYLPADAHILYNLFCCIFVSMTVFVLSPVEAPNKPLADKKRDSVRNWSIGIVTVDLFICLVPVFTQLQEITLYSTYYITGAVLAGVSLIAARKHSQAT